MLTLTGFEGALGVLVAVIMMGFGLGLVIGCIANWREDR